jgi:hypothetical protein
MALLAALEGVGSGWLTRPLPLSVSLQDRRFVSVVDDDVNRLVTASLAALRRSVRPGAGAVRVMMRDARLISPRKAVLTALWPFAFQFL